MAFGTAGRQPTGDPERPLAFGTHVQLPDERGQPGGILRTHELPEVAAGHRLGRTLKNLRGRRIRAGDVEVLVEFEDGIHCAAEQPPEFRFPFAHLRLGPQTLELRGGPGGEDAENRMDARFGRDRTAVDHGHMAENRPGRVEERDTHVADSPRLAEFFFMRVNLEDVVGKMDELRRVDDLLARGAGDVDFVSGHPPAVHPEGEGAQLTALGKILRDPGSVSIEGLRQVLHQGRKELLARGGGGSFEDRA